MEIIKNVGVTPLAIESGGLAYFGVATFFFFLFFFFFFLFYLFIFLKL